MADNNEEKAASSNNGDQDKDRALVIAQMLQQLQLAQGGLGAPKSEEQARQKQYKFWETQPVPKITEKLDEFINEPIDPCTDVEKISKVGIPLPEGFIWVNVDIDDETELSDLYNLLFENYVEDDDNMFRFNYSKEFLRWVLKPPGWRVDWWCGVRAAPKEGQTKPGKLLAFVSAVPAKIRAYDKKIDVVDINFLCVHKKLRSKRMTPVMIREITRRVNLTGVWQALYTAGVYIPKPISTARYFHRSLNPKKLIECRFSALGRNQTMARIVKLNRLPDELKLSGVRPMQKKDAKAVMNLLNENFNKFDLVPVFSEEEVLHWLSPIEDVIQSFVVERVDAETKKKRIVAFFSYYVLPSTVMDHPQHKEIKAAYAFYNVATEDITLTQLMQDALIQAKNTNFDVFNALNQMENEEYLTELKFGTGDGNLHFYLFNWRCPDMTCKRVGIVLQ